MKHQRTLESANNKMIRDISVNYGRDAYVRAESKVYGTDAYDYENIKGTKISTCLLIKQKGEL